MKEPVLHDLRDIDFTTFVNQLQIPDADDPDLLDPSCDPENPVAVTYEDILGAVPRISENVIITPAKQQAKRGVIAASAGNHALGLSYHGKLLNIPVIVVMPTTATLMKMERCVGYGARLVLKGVNLAESKRFALKLSKLLNLTYINGYDHPQILAGQGTIGIEILRQVPDVHCILVPVGGGGLIAGVSVAIKNLKPEVQIIGVESESCAAFSASLANGKPTFTPCLPSCADGLAVSVPGGNSVYSSLNLVDKMVQVKETDIHRAIVRLLEVEKCVVEGSGAIGLAAIMSGLLPELKGKTVVSILSGGNIDTTVLGRVIERGLTAEGRMCRFLVVVSDQPGSIADLCAILKDLGVSIKDIFHQRAWLKSNIFNVEVKCVCETRDAKHIDQLERALRARYDSILFGDDVVW